MCIHNNYIKCVTSLREDVVLLEFDILGPWVLIIHAHDQIAVEHIKLLTTVASYGPTQSPYSCKQEQALQPHGYLLAGHILFTTGYWCSNFIWV